MTTESLPDDAVSGPIGRLFASRTFLDSFADGIVLQDLDGRIVDANRAASDLLGVDRGDLLSRTSFDPLWPAVHEDGTPFADDERPSTITRRTRESCFGMVMGVQSPHRGLTWLNIDTYPVEVDGELIGISSLFYDVSSEVSTREELRATTDHLRILAKYPADVVILASQDAVGQWCSDSVTPLMGWQPEEVIGKRIDSFVHPDDLSKILLLRSREPDAVNASFLVRLRRKRGDYRWISISARRFVDEVTKESRIVSSWRDAQALVETHQRLESSEARFQFLAENASDVVVESDPAFNVSWVSPSVFELLGWRPDEMVGRATIEFVFPEDRPAILYERANVASGMKRQPVKARFLTSSGAVRWMVARTRSNLGADGTIVSNMVSLRDVHEEEMVRHEFAAAEDRYRLLAENGADLILLLDADQVYRWASPSSMELFGWRPEEIIGKRVQDFAHPDEIAAIVRQRDLRTDELFSIEPFRFRRADGEYRWVSGRGRNVRTSEGTLTSRIIALRDITSEVLTEQRLEQSESLFRLVLENQVDVTARLSPDGIIEWITPSVFTLLGRRQDEVIGHNIDEFLHTQDVSGLDYAKEQINAGDLSRLEARLVTITGEEKWVAANAKPLLDDVGRVTGSVVNVRDISLQHAAWTQLAQSANLFQLALESAPVGMAVVDLDRCFVAVNPALCDMVSRSSPWLLTHSVADILDPDDDQVDLHMRREALSGRVDHAGRQVRLRRPDGTTVWVEHAIGQQRDEFDQPLSFVSTFVDVTESRAAHEQLHFQATHDSLTQLVNRRDLYLRAESLQQRVTRTGEHVGVLYIDIDGFKVVNDTFGHFVGDTILTAAARRLKAAGRKDDVVARVGGDEFVILLTTLHSVDDALSVAQKIVEEFREPLTSAGESITLGVSVGVALVLPAESVDDTLRRADAALYQAKMRGRGRVVQWSSDFT